MGYEAFARAVRKTLSLVGAERRCRRIMRAFYAAASDPRKIPWEQAGAAERAAFALADLLHAAAQVAEVEDRMIALLGALGYAELARTVPGLSEVGAAAILAETGDPDRYDSGRAWAKHAGACPRDNASGRQQGRTKVSGRGRQLLRTAAWRAVWPLVQHNAVFAARYRHLTGREEHKLTDGQARMALAAMLLRQLWAVFRYRRAWDPALAEGTVAEEVAPAA